MKHSGGPRVRSSGPVDEKEEGPIDTASVLYLVIYSGPADEEEEGPIDTASVL